MAGRLKGKVCVITGTGGSMGSAAARLFAGEGGKLVGCDVNVQNGRAVAEEIVAQGGEMVSIQPCDLTSVSDCQSLVDLALSTFGRIDVLFNNAAMAYFQPFAEMDDGLWHRTINEELNLVYNLTRRAWPALIATSGSIITTASCSAWLGFPAVPATAHAAAKGAIVAMTRQLAVEGASAGIRVNTISPGLIETNQTRELLKDPEFSKTMLEKILLKRAGKPLEVANAALFLASDEAAFITGTDLRIDGGTCAW